MQFRDLGQQYKVLKDDIDAAIQQVISSGHFIMGPQVKELERQLAEFVGSKHCITCANGTDALTLSLKVWGISTGDAVFVPDFTFFSSAEVVSYEGATPVFVDVSAETYNIEPADLERAIEETIKEGKLTPKVVITVDLFGLPADYPKIKQICEKYGLLLLEDGAQGFGGEINGQRACSFGDISTTSFFPAKSLGCYGDGGALFTDNEEWAALADSYRVHGKGTCKYDNVRIGMNSRLDTLQAAILQVKLKAFVDYELDAVNNVAAEYTKKLSGMVTVPLVPDGYYSSWAQYTIQLENKEKRDAMQMALKEAGIPSMVYYPTTMHCQTAYRYLNYTANSCPVSLRLCDTVLSLPMYPYLKHEEINKIYHAIQSNL